MKMKLTKKNGDVVEVDGTPDELKALGLLEDAKECTLAHYPAACFLNHYPNYYYWQYPYYPQPYWPNGGIWYQNPSWNILPAMNGQPWNSTAVITCNNDFKPLNSMTTGEIGAELGKLEKEGFSWTTIPNSMSDCSGMGGISYVGDPPISTYHNGAGGSN